MPSYRIHRLKDHLRLQFRSAPHVSGTAGVKPRDYLPGIAAGEAAAEFSGETISASSPYAAYFELKDGTAPLAPGDLLRRRKRRSAPRVGASRYQVRWFRHQGPQWVAATEVLAPPALASEVDSAAAGEAPKGERTGRVGASSSP